MHDLVCDRCREFRKTETKRGTYVNITSKDGRKPRKAPGTSDKTRASSDSNGSQLDRIAPNLMYPQW